MNENMTPLPYISQGNDSEVEQNGLRIYAGADGEHVVDVYGADHSVREQRAEYITHALNAYPAAQKMAEALERVQQRHDQGIPFGSGNDVAMVEEALTLWQQVTQEDK